MSRPEVTPSKATSDMVMGCRIRRYLIVLISGHDLNSVIEIESGRKRDWVSTRSSYR